MPIIFSISKKSLQLILFILGLIILVYFVFTSGILENYSVFFKINIFFLLVAVLLSLMNMLFKVVRWKYLSTQYECPITWADASMVTISSFFYANITPGKIGDLFKAYYMKKRFDLHLPSGISMIFYERFFEIVILFIFSFFILFKNFDDTSIILLQLTAVIIGSLVIFYFKSDFILAIATRILVKIGKTDMPNLNFSLHKIALPQVIMTIVISFISLAFEFGRLWLVILAFGYYIDPIETAIFFSISIIFGLISQIPLGLGVMEGSLSVLLERSGIPLDYSLAIVLVDRVISMYFALVIGFIVCQFSLKEIIRNQEE